MIFHVEHTGTAQILHVSNGPERFRYACITQEDAADLAIELIYAAQMLIPREMQSVQEPLDAVRDEIRIWSKSAEGLKTIF